MCGDATSEEDVAQLMVGEKQILSVTDHRIMLAFESSDGLSIKNVKMANDKSMNFCFLHLRTWQSIWKRVDQRMYSMQIRKV